MPRSLLSLSIAALLSVPAAAEALLSVDFDRGEPRAYTMGQWRADFPNAPWQSGGIVSGRAALVADDTPGHAGLNLRVAFPAGSVGPGNGSANDEGGNGGGGVNFPATFGTPAETATLTYRFKFEDGFDFSRGGKLPGLAGFGLDNRIASGGRPADGTSGFSARGMWFRDGRATQYVYHMDVGAPNAPYGDRFYYQHPDGSDFFYETGRWYEMSTTLKLNTPDAADGFLETTLDGVTVMRREGLRFRTDPAVQIDNVYVSTFHGGADITWSPANDSYIRFDDFRVVTGAPIPEPSAGLGAAAIGLAASRTVSRRR